MAIIDFPNPPLTIGQRYDAPNGAAYFWDGEVWGGLLAPPGGGGGTLNTPTGPAGGDLTGSYPNPTIAVGAVERATLGPDVLPSLPPLPTLANAGQILMVNATGDGLIYASPGISVGIAAPVNPMPGTMWFRPDPDANLYVWYDDGTSTQWVPASSTGGTGYSAVFIGNVPPVSALPGQLWWRNASDGNLYVFHDDGSSRQWVPATAYVGEAGPVTAPGPVEFYRHTQATAATVWTVIHNLPFQPQVTAVDSTGDVIVPGTIDYVSATTITLTFSVPASGEAYCS